MTPSRDSRRLMLRLTPPCVISRPSAAAVMHPGATDTKACNSGMGKLQAHGVLRMSDDVRHAPCACRQCACRNLDGRLRAGHAAVKGLVSVGGQFALKFKFYRP